MKSILTISLLISAVAFIACSAGDDSEERSGVAVPVAPGTATPLMIVHPTQPPTPPDPVPDPPR
jgi:hypothetical protein